MKYIKYILLTLIVLSFVNDSVLSQEKNEYQLAYSYYRNNEFDKAADMFEKLFDKTKSRIYFNFYIDCLTELREFEKAEKKIKKQISRRNPDYSYYVQLGNIYKSQGNLSKEEEQYEKVIKNLQPNKNQIIAIANYFIRQRDYDWAEKVYEKGRNLINYHFYFEMANLYANARKNNEMIEQYLNLIEVSSKHSETVKATLQYYVNNDVNEEFYDLLRTNLLRKIQKSGKLVFNEMLIWLFIQKKEFSGALMQAKAIDKRRNENGIRIIRLAELARENNELETAYQAFEYVSKKGRFLPFYYQSRHGMTNILYLKVLNGQIKTKEEIKELEDQYLATIEEFGLSSQTINLIKDLAHLEAFFLNKPNEAISLLTQAIKLRNITNQQRGICQIELGDIQLLQGDIWSATLTYAKAEDSNKTNSIGDLAKFKKSKIAFYSGNFKWAHSQLDVLKASTSKLIANDAMELSQLIKNNVHYPDEGDSSLTEKQIQRIEAPLAMYSRADLLLNQHNDTAAIQTLDNLIAKFSNHSLVDESLFLKAKIYTKANNWTQAALNYQKIVDNYAFDVLADKAMFNLANIYQYKLKDKEKAMELYKKLLQDYQGSLYIVEARKRFRELRGN